tara:strand:+ start:379 stop:519 length:141 start_codon:yes stop_codon:yes gene_type:complete
MLESDKLEKETSLQGSGQKNGINESITEGNSELPNPEDVGFEMPML